MKRRSKEEENGDEVVYRYRRGLGARVGGLVLTIGLVSAILYIAALAVSRTDGFRSVVAERISDWSGFAVEVEDVKLQPNLDLVINGLRAGEDEGGLGVRISKARVEWSILGFLTWGKGAVRSVDLQAGSILFRPDAKGRWQPAWLHVPFSAMIEGSGNTLTSPNPDALSEIPSADKKKTPTGLSTASAGAFWEDVSLRIQDGHLAWQDADGNVQASVSGLNLSVTPLVAPLRTLHHFQAWMDDLRIGSQRMKGTALEFIAYDDKQIVLAFESEWTGPGTSLPPGSP